MRLIDADELKTAFPCGESVRTECVRATIDHMPTVDAIPVVRCEDCVYRISMKTPTGPQYLCARLYDIYDIVMGEMHKVNKEDFCSWGERRENA